MTSKLLGFLLVSLFFTISVISVSNVFASVSLNSSINASHSVTDSSSQQIAVSGNNVDTIYLEEGDLYYDNNSSGFVGTRIKQNNDTASFPEIAVSGTDKYLVWLQNDSLLYNNTSVPASAKKLITGVSSSDTSNMLAVSGSNVHIVFSQGGVLNYINSTGNFANAASPVTIHADDFNENQQLAVSGSTLHITWQNSNGVYYKNNTNNFASPALLLGTGSIPQLAVSGSDVHFVWKQNGLTPQIKYANLVANVLSTPITLSDSSNAANNPKIATGGGNVYAVWQETIGTNKEIFFASSASGFTPINLSNDLGASTEPQIAVSGSNVFVTWKDSSFNSAIYERSSSNNGSTFGTFTVLSDIANIATNPKLAVSGTDVVSSWLENISGSNDVFVRTGQSNANFVTFDKEEYILSDHPVLTYTIPSKAGDTTSSDTIPVTISSTSDGPGITANLTESGDTGVFTGTFSLTAGLSDDTSDTIQAFSGGLIFASHLSGSASSHIAPITVILDEGGISTTAFDFGSIAGITVNDRSANLNNVLSETVTVHVTTTQNPTGIDLTLTETGVNTGVFDNAQLAFMIGNDIYPIGSQVIVSLENAFYDTTSNADTILVSVTSTTTPGGINLQLAESGPNTGIFSGILTLSSSGTDGLAGIIKVSVGDFITTIDPSNSWGSTGMISPNPNFSNGIIEVTPTGEPLLTVTYGLASDTAEVLDLGASGGGGGGIARAGLIVNALSGFGGSGEASAPQLSLNNLIQNKLIDASPEIKKIISSQDPTIPIKPMSLDSFNHFDFPLVINDAGFLLGGFSNTLQTISLNVNEPVKMKFTFYEPEKIQHFSLYTNLRAEKTTIPQSNAQILYNDGKSLKLVDPEGLFDSVNVKIKNDGPLKKLVLVEIIFAKPMDTSDIIVRSWDPSLNSIDTYILDAIKVMPATSDSIVTLTPATPPTSVLSKIAPTAVLSETTPTADQAESQTIPSWIKNNASWWSKDQIGDKDFVSGIEYLINNKIINIPSTEPVNSSVKEIPTWIQNTASWWSEDQITDNEFTNAMGWLVTNGIIKVQL